MDTTKRPMPQARDEELVVQELRDETLVYDLKRHRAHALNQTAAWVWRHCDGKTSVPEMAAQMQRGVNLPESEEAIRLALERLGRAHLLRSRVSPQAGVAPSSRRALIRNLAAIGGLALVTSIIAPEAAYATSACASHGAGTDRACMNAACATGHTCHLNTTTSKCECRLGA